MYLTCEQSFFVARKGYAHQRRKLFYIQRAVHRKAEPLCKRYIVLRSHSFKKCFKTRFVKGEAECYKFIFKDIFYSVQHVIEVEELAVYGLNFLRALVCFQSKAAQRRTRELFRCRIVFKSYLTERYARHFKLAQKSVYVYFRFKAACVDRQLFYYRGEVEFEYLTYYAHYGVIRFGVGSRGGLVGVGSREHRYYLLYALRKFGYVALYLYVALCSEHVGYV